MRPNYRKTARQEAHAEAAPQIRGVRRGTRQEVRGLRSMENPLVEGVENQIDSLKSAGLRRPEYERAMEEAASSLAQIPAGISSQVLSAREAGNEAISDLKANEASSFHSLLSQLQLAAAEHAQKVQDEVAAEGRQNRNAITRGELEKQLGLGDYAPDPLDPLKQAEVGKVEAETNVLKHPNSAAALTPSERRGLSEDHAAAAHYAKQLFQEAKAGAFEEAGIGADPKAWDSQIWNGLVTHVAEKSKVPIPAAETAVSAIQDHVRGPSALGALGSVAQAAGASVAPAVLPPALAKIAQAALGY